MLAPFIPPVGEPPFYGTSIAVYHPPDHIPDFEVPVTVRRWNRKSKEVLLVFPNLPPVCTARSFLLNELRYSPEEAEELLRIQETTEAMLIAVPNRGSLSFGSIEHGTMHSTTRLEFADRPEAVLLLQAVQSLGFKLKTVDRLVPIDQFERLILRDKLAKKARES